VIRGPDLGRAPLHDVPHGPSQEPRIADQVPRAQEPGNVAGREMPTCDPVEGPVGKVVLETGLRDQLPRGFGRVAKGYVMPVISQLAGDR